MEALLIGALHTDGEGVERDGRFWVRCGRAGPRATRRDFWLFAAIPTPAAAMPPATPRLFDLVKGRMLARHLSPRTVQAYVAWIIRYIRYHGLRHPKELGEREVIVYLTYLAVERRVLRSTQMQALSALMLLYREVLNVPLPDLRRVLRSNAPAHLPAVLSREEVGAVIARLEGTTRLIALLLYGAGLRLEECLTLRLKYLDFVRREIRVRRRKGGGRIG